MAGKIGRLAPEIRHILKYAACVGNIFDSATLSTIGGYSPGKTLRHLMVAVTEGLIIPLDGRYSFVAGIEESTYEGAAFIQICSRPYPTGRVFPD